MASINNLEPQAFGHFTFVTTFGDIDVELFTKQCPKVTKNFVQHCLDGYYEGTIFHRVEKDFIAIAGDAEICRDSPYDACPDEFNSRLRFNRRGLIATANTKKDENGPEFFFTLGAAQELQNKHTIFGRVMGNSIFNLVDLNECQVDEDCKPYSEKKILEVKVVNNPYPELSAKTNSSDRNFSKPPQNDDHSSSSHTSHFLIKTKSSNVNAKKLSFFPDEDEDDDNEEEDSNKTIETRLEVTKKETTDRLNDSVQNEERKVSKKKQNTIKVEENNCQQERDREEDESYTEPPLDAKKKRLLEIRKQIMIIKDQIEKDTETKTLSEHRKEAATISIHRSSSSSQPEGSSSLDCTVNKKSKHRDRETIELVKNFKKKLKEASEEPSKLKPRIEVDLNEISVDYSRALDRADSDEWLLHKFEANEDIRLAKDANTKDDSWYSVDDPRNSINRRSVAKSHARNHSHHISSGKSEITKNFH